MNKQEDGSANNNKGNRRGRDSIKERQTTEEEKDGRRTMRRISEIRAVQATGKEPWKRECRPGSISRNKQA